MLRIALCLLLLILGSRQEPWKDMYQAISKVPTPLCRDYRNSLTTGPRMLDYINPKTDSLGSGGFGSVFEVFWKGQKVAIKVSVDVDIAIREVNILKYLQGIGRIPRLIDCEVSKEGVFLAQTLMKTSLASKESKQEFHSKNKFLDRLEIFARLADTFEKIHEMKVIHNDIKPHNLMLTNAMYDIYPIDFGVSKLPL